MIACYSRVSTTEQALNGYSLNEQNERMEKYCEALGLKGIKIYSDPGFSGANVNRPGLQSMITDIRAGNIQKVIVYKLDRLSRSQRDTLFLIEDVFLANNCDFVSMSENFDTSTPLGRAMVGILSVFAQLEREQIKERMIMGKEARAKKGKWHGGGHPPLGYDYVDGELVVNEYLANQVREIFRLYASGTMPTQIVEMLNQNGYRTQTGKEWTLYQLRRVLKNRSYLGEVSDGKEWFKGSHEPLTDEKTFLKAQNLLSERKEKFKSLRVTPNQNNISTYFGGIIYCKRCGAKYSICRSLHNNIRFEYYGCYSRSKKAPTMIKDPNCKNKYWKKKDLDDLVLGEISKLSLEKFRVQEQKKPDLKPSKRRINDIDNQISRLIDLYGRENISVEVLDEKIKALMEEKEKLSAQIEAQSASNGLTEKEIIKYINSFDDVVKKGKLDEIRAIIFALINRIEIDGEDVSIHWNF